MSIDYLHFSMELHKFHGRAPFACVEEVDPRDEDYFSVMDISSAFLNDAAEDAEGIAFHINFSMPADFDGSEPVFDKLKAYGIEPERLKDICRRAAMGEPVAESIGPTECDHA